MRIVDSQVHIVGREALGLSATVGGAVGAATAKHFGDSSVISGDEMLVAMDAVGVDSAVLVVTSHYGFDNSYSLEAARKYPDRYRVTGRLDPQAPDIDEQVAAWRVDPLTAALRFLILTDEQRAQLVDGYFDPLLDACRRHGVPVATYPAGHLDALEPVIRRYDDVFWLIDHLGLSQPPVLQPDPEPFERLPQLLALADMPGVNVKLTGMAAMSQDPYPYADLKRPFEALMQAFGAQRLMWGTDWTRTKSILPYRPNVTFLDDLGALGSDDKELLFAANTRRVFDWDG